MKRAKNKEEELEEETPDFPLGTSAGTAEQCTTNTVQSRPRGNGEATALAADLAAPQLDPWAAAAGLGAAALSGGARRCRAARQAH